MRAAQRRNRPAPLKRVRERPLHAVGGGMPEAHGAILTAREDERELGVAADGGHVVLVPLHGLDALLGLVVPDLDHLVVRAGDEVGAVAAGEVVDAVDALLVALEGEVGVGVVEAPHLDGLVQGGGGEGVCVLGVEDHHHHVVRVAFVDHGVLPALLPVPELDAHVVRGGDHHGLRGVHGDAPDVVRVRLPDLHLLHGVVVVHANLHVIGA
mmetsp:Transcript_20472/g.60437  ORF Transcript_20472/g.60437 Transcript_20472/m.60437 type:complete len:211 (+) Transcript_20472:1881-2513(+)